MRRKRIVVRAVKRCIKLQEMADLFDTDFGFYWAHYTYADEIAAKHYFAAFNDERVSNGNQTNDGPPQD